jgi:hypothetical protein
MLAASSRCQAFHQTDSRCSDFSPGTDRYRSFETLLFENHALNFRSRRKGLRSHLGVTSQLRMLGPVKPSLVQLVSEHVLCLGSADGKIQPSQQLGQGSPFRRTNITRVCLPSWATGTVSAGTTPILISVKPGSTQPTWKKKGLGP